MARKAALTLAERKAQLDAEVEARVAMLRERVHADLAELKLYGCTQWIGIPPMEGETSDTPAPALPPGEREHPTEQKGDMRPGAGTAQAVGTPLNVAVSRTSSAEPDRLQVGDILEGPTVERMFGSKQAIVVAASPQPDLEIPDFLKRKAAQ